MKQIHLTIFLVIGILITISSLIKAQSTYIQVISEPGVSVFLNNVLKGKTTSEMGGLIIEGVSPGSHTIKVVKEGFNPQEDRISVKKGEVYSYTVKPFVPSVSS